MRKFFYLSVIAILVLTFNCYNQNLIASASENTLTVIAGESVYIFKYPEVERCLDGLRLKDADEIIENIYQSDSVKPVDAKMIFTPNSKQRFKIEKEIYGRQLNKEKLTQDIENTLAMGGGIVRARFDVLQPKLTAKQLQNATYERARFTTYFSQNQDRITNIIRASSFINGCTINSGEQFSFNDIVGMRTEERGFKLAKIIINGEYVEGVGGGVCQVSTTLYNSALLSGLEIVEQHHHSLAVGYIEPSFDAMVNSGSSDLIFKNNTDLPIFIESEVGENYICFRIFGAKNKLEYQRTSVVTETIVAKTQQIQADYLPFGEQRIVRSPINGYKSQGYLTAFENGKQVWCKKIREDSYLAVNGLMEVNNVKE